MGCCLSTPSPPPFLSSTAALTSPSITSLPPSRHPSISTSTSPSHPRPRPRSSFTPIPRVNYPLIRPPWISRRPWTPATLDAYRSEFFETRVSGRPEIWLALQRALSLLWSLDRTPLSSDLAATAAAALEDARSILSAAGLTLPTGQLIHGAYDSSGILYQLPAPVVSDPTNLSTSASYSPPSRSRTPSPPPSPLIPKESPFSDPDAGPSETPVKITVRLSTVRDVSLTVSPKITVGELGQLVEATAGVRADMCVKMIYLGRQLKKDKGVAAQGWVVGHVINAMVVPKIGRRT